jgi:predicted RNase H-like nuclease (RuvC/YqgF family)
MNPPAVAVAPVAPAAVVEKSPKELKQEIEALKAQKNELDGQNNSLKEEIATLQNQLSTDTKNVQELKIEMANRVYVTLIRDFSIALNQPDVMPDAL